MEKEIIYEKVCMIQNKLWEHNDMMMQETLFDLQDIVCDFALRLAEDLHMEDDLIHRFPWLYRRNKNE